MDLVELQEIIYFASGMIAALLTAYGTMKAQNKTLYPIRKIEDGKAKIKKLTESNAVLGGVAELVSEISAEEVADMIAKKKELDATPGISKEQKALTLGMMFMNAVKE